METKKFYCDSTQTYKFNIGVTIFFGTIALIGIILLLSPILMYRLSDGFLGDFFDDPYMIVIVLTALGLLGFIPNFKMVRRMAKTPVVEISNDSIMVTNMNTGQVNEIKYKDIDRLELSHIPLFGKKIVCINIFPAKGVYDKIIMRHKKADRKRIEGMYKRVGAIEQIFENLLNNTAAALYDDIMESFNEYKNRNNN